MDESSSFLCRLNVTFHIFVHVDPSSNLTQIQEVSDLILKAKLPLSIAKLKTKLDELKNLAANLPNSTAVLKKAEPQLDAAKKLLQEAQDARCASTLYCHETLTCFSNVY